MERICDDCGTSNVPGHFSKILKILKIRGTIAGLALCLDCARERGIEYNEWVSGTTC